MAFDPAPSYWIAGWAVDASDIVVPIASLTGLTLAEADGITGDIRDVLFSLIEKIWSDYDGLDAADRPTKMTITKNTGYSTGGEIKRTYVIEFKTQVASEDVAAE
ncbi:MAG: hypothetical protein WC718_00185 [Phycisphaerales bacterium]|jgi:hypothetical protein